MNKQTVIRQECSITDVPHESRLTGRNGTFDITAFSFGTYGNKAAIDGYCNKGFALNGGFWIFAKDLDQACIKYLIARGILNPDTKLGDPNDRSDSTPNP